MKSTRLQCVLNSHTKEQSILYFQDTIFKKKRSSQGKVSSDDILCITTQLNTSSFYSDVQVYVLIMETAEKGRGRRVVSLLLDSYGAFKRKIVPFQSFSFSLWMRHRYCKTSSTVMPTVGLHTKLTKKAPISNTESPAVFSIFRWNHTTSYHTESNGFTRINE
jgi:hypothetical protein